MCLIVPYSEMNVGEKALKFYCVVVFYIQSTFFLEAPAVQINNQLKLRNFLPKRSLLCTLMLGWQNRQKVPIIQFKSCLTINKTSDI